MSGGRVRRLPLTALVAVMSFSSVALIGGGLRETLTRGSAGQDVGLGLVEEGGGSVDLEAVPGAPGMRFGIDADAVDRFSQHAGPPDYGTIWVGKWNLDHGWQGTDAKLSELAARNVTPAIHLWYWGDDISRTCFSQGCNGKDVMGWQVLTEQLVQHMAANLGGREAVVILESEFNKHGVHNSEDLDTMLAEKATYLHAYYPMAKVVLALGNWFPQAWDTWDRAAQASDYVGLQAMAGSTRNDDDHYRGLARSTLDGAKLLRDLFGKPLFIQDVAVSSYPEPDYLDRQAEAVADFAAELPALQAVGVEAVIYRSYLDVPDMALDNHYAEAERHWGLAWHGTGVLKPAGEAWLAAVQNARAPPVPADAGNVSAPVAE